MRKGVVDRDAEGVELDNSSYMDGRIEVEWVGDALDMQGFFNCLRFFAGIIRGSKRYEV